MDLRHRKRSYKCLENLISKIKNMNEENTSICATKALLAVMEKTPAWMVTVTMEEEIYAHVFVDPGSGEILNVEVLP